MMQRFTCQVTKHLRQIVFGPIALANENKTRTLVTLRRWSAHVRKGVSDGTGRSPPRGRNLRGQDQGAGCGALADRARFRQGLDHAARQEPEGARDRDGVDRLARPRYRARRRRSAARPRRSRSTGRNPRARPPSPCTSSPRRRRRGGVCAFIDAEHALDPVYARKLGVNLEDLLISQPDTGRASALEITDTLVRSGAVDVLVIDSGRCADAARRDRRRNG